MGSAIVLLRALREVPYPLWASVPNHPSAIDGLDGRGTLLAPTISLLTMICHPVAGSMGWQCNWDTPASRGEVCPQRPLGKYRLGHRGIKTPWLQMPVPGVKLSEFWKNHSLCSDLCKWFRNQGVFTLFLDPPSCSSQYYYLSNPILSLPLLPTATYWSVSITRYSTSYRGPSPHTFLLAHSVFPRTAQFLPVPSHCTQFSQSPTTPHSSFYSFNKHIVSTQNMPGTLLGSGNMAVNRADLALVFRECLFWKGKTDSEQINI